MKKLGIFGGTFDPVHNGHLLIAETVLTRTEVEEILFLPSARPPHKTDQHILPFEHRMHMVRLAIEGKKCMAADDMEFRLGGLSYTVRTLETMKEVHPGVEWHLIIGADSLLGLPAWKEPDRLIREVRFIVYPRAGADTAHAEKRFMERAVMLDVPLTDFSSSEIRSRLRRGLSVHGMVPESVERYITENKLYFTH